MARLQTRLGSKHVQRRGSSLRTRRENLASRHCAVQQVRNKICIDLSIVEQRVNSNSYAHSLSVGVATASLFP